MTAQKQKQKREIEAKIASFAVTIGDNARKEYKISTYFQSEAAMDAALCALGLVRRDEFVFDPIYPYRAAQGEKLIGRWYAPGKWVPPGEWDCVKGHPGEKEWDEFMAKNGGVVGDVLDGIWGEEVA